MESTVIQLSSLLLLQTARIQSTITRFAVIHDWEI